MQTYLGSVKALATPEEYACTEEAVKQFVKAGGIGPVLQQRLLERSKAFAGSSWLQEWWNHDIYLLGRTSLVIDYNFYFHLADDKHLPPFTANSGTAVQVLAAARLLRSILQFRDQLVAGTAPVEVMGRAPQCCSQWKYLLNACRVPQKVKDEVHLYDPTKHNTLCVMRHNKVFTFPSHHADGRLLTTAEFAAQLDNVIQMAGTTAGPAVGILTSDERDPWAEARQQLVADGNLETLEALQSSILLLCLDDEVPIGNEAVGRLLLHGAPSTSNNRWFDKSVQLIVFRNGVSGVMGEHSLMDASPLFFLITTALRGLRDNKVDHGPNDCTSLLPEPAYHPFSLSPASMQNIYERSRRFDEQMSIHDLKVLHFMMFGGKRLKELKCSPDAFAQMAIQLAAFKVFGCTKPTYEATATRSFVHGRTETTRSVSVQSQAWVAAMQRRGDPVQKASLLVQALQAHSDYTRKAAKGLGCDRHLLGLRRSLKTGETASIFEDPMYNRTRYWNVSTSALSNDVVQRMGFGEVVPDGIGVGYGTTDHALEFTITSRDYRDLWAPAMCYHLNEALLEMRWLLETARAVPHSRL
eukprot:GGOE01020369.1.p1 GENE.GGOE01020369.1~~GGOE01020369.1.p1  ORF type:complete len:645 (+),score=219.42 GGOE01020369.1:190-1935(+)